MIGLVVKVPQKDWSKNHLSTWMLILAPSGWPKTAKLHLEILVATVYMQIFSILLFLSKGWRFPIFLYIYWHFCCLSLKRNTERQQIKEFVCMSSTLQKGPILPLGECSAQCCFIPTGSFHSHGHACLRGAAWRRFILTAM